MARYGLHIAVAFASLVITAAAWTALFGQVRVGPDVVAVAALYVGLTSRGTLSPALATALAIGYLADILTGSPAGLHALIGAVVCFAGHIAQGRYVLRGRVVTAIGCAAAALLAGLLAVGLARAGGVGAVVLEPVLLLESAAVTALVGPAQLWFHRRLDGRLARTQRERDAALEGVAAP